MAAAALCSDARAGLRVLRLLLHLFVGAGLVAVVFPCVDRVRRVDLQRRWARGLLRIVAVRLECSGTDLRPGCLLVANHVSWLDIFAIMALQPAAFVAKAEMRNWPLLGWLAAKTGNIFLRRGSRGHARLINREIAGVLNAGGNVAVFPEGTTTDGTHMLHFHAALLEPALACARQVQAISLAYRDGNGQASSAAAYAGATSLWQSLFSIARAPGLRLHLRVFPPLAGTDRRSLAAAARALIAADLGLA